MGEIFLSTKEAKRLYVMERVLEGSWAASEAAKLLGLSIRQVFRLKGEMAANGEKGLVHKNRGRKPKHAVTEETRQLVIAQALGPYKGASYEHIAELLAERDGIRLCAKTIGRILKGTGIVHSHTHRPARRFRRRVRSSAEGMLIQIDASTHDWLEERGPWLALHGAIDDATGKILGLHFRPTEDATGYFRMLECVLTKHGLPQALYSDRHTIFLSPKDGKLSIEEELAGKEVALTQFGQALAELRIRHVTARTPQAKGRIERLWGTLQERLVIEMRLAGINTLEDANAFLEAYIDRHNEKFAVPPENPQSAFGKKLRLSALKPILCFREYRKAANDSSFSFKSQIYTLKERRMVKLMPGAIVEILIHLDGTLSGRVNGKVYAMVPFLKTLPTPQTKPNNQKEARKTPVKPAANHPWRQSAANAAARKAALQV